MTRQPTTKDPLLAALQSEAMDADAPLGVGQGVLAEWNGAVYPATVRRVSKDGRVKISYDDYDASWDELVTRDRLRVLAPHPPVVTLHIDGAAPQSGLIVGRVGEFFDVKRASDGRRLLVNTRSVAIIELPEPAPAAENSPP